jgi:hypothetical protein
MRGIPMLEQPSTPIIGYDNIIKKSKEVPVPQESVWHKG